MTVTTVGAGTVGVLGSVTTGLSLGWGEGARMWDVEGIAGEVWARVVIVGTGRKGKEGP